MSNKRKNTPRSAATKNPTSSKIAKPPMSKRGLIFVGLIALVIVAVGTVGGFFLLSNQTATPTPAAKIAKPAHIGEVDCPAEPKFVLDQHFATDPAFSTSERGITGLALVRNDPANPGGPHLIYQEPSWKIAGNLATIVIGKDGEAFTAPAPFINVLENPVNQQNEIYRVDPNTGVMSHYLTLAQAQPGGTENPYGVLGLAYDCEITRLYAASVAGSTRSQQVGRVFAIDTGKASQLDELDNIDVLGLGIFDGAQGKRLYLGLARLPEIWSISLDASGKFMGKPSFEFSLAGKGPRGSDKARKIVFNGQNQMQVYGIEFNFNLIAPTERLQTVYTYNYDETNDSWTYVSAQNGGSS